MAGTVTPILRALVTTVKVSRRGSSSFAHVADRLRLPVQPQEGWSILPSRGWFLVTTDPANSQVQGTSSHTL